MNASRSQTFFSILRMSKGRLRKVLVATEIYFTLKKKCIPEVVFSPYNQTRRYLH